MSGMTIEDVIKEVNRRRSRKRAERIMSFLFGMALILARAWLLMIAVGVAHAEWLHQLPTIGFPPCLMLSILLRLSFMTLDLKKS